MAVHHLKTHPESFRQVASKNKTFEFRKNDRNFQVDDILVLEEYDPTTSEYTGDSMVVTVMYILYEGYGLPDSYCIMSIKMA